MELEIVKQEASTYEKNADGVLLEIELMKFESDQDANFGAHVLREVKENLKGIEERRKEITVPLNAALNSVNGLFRPARDALERCEKNLKEKLAGYQERKQLANRAAMGLAAKSEVVEEAQQALALVDQSGPPKGVSVRHVWKFEVTRPDDVPPELCGPDLEKIGDWIKQHYNKLVEGESMIPGVRLFKQPIVASRKV